MPPKDKQRFCPLPKRYVPLRICIIRIDQRKNTNDEESKNML